MTNNKQADDMLELLQTSKEEFITINKEYLKSIGKEYYDLMEHTKGKIIGVNHPEKCPLHLWVVYNKQKCKNELVSNTAVCPLCNNPVCPDCMNHEVEQLSRVTGYMGGVSGWNAAKQQEFKDRSRYNL